MRVKCLRWIDTKLELTKIGIEWDCIMLAAQKYQYKPEFLWTKDELDEVIELFEKAYELSVREVGIWLMMDKADFYRKTMSTLNDLTRELWTLKQRRALAA